MEQWLEITLETTGPELDTLAAKLTMNGAEGLVLEDESDFRQFLEQNRQYWDYVDDALLERMRGVARIKFYVTDDDAGRENLRLWLTGIENPYTAAPIRQEDWAYSWQKYYHAMPVGERLFIVPEWERDRALDIPTERTVVYLNPGLTFGTGSHASTQLCLQLIEHWVNPESRLLDLGCGSGILSIAALCLGSASAICADIDPKASEAAYENAAQNGIGRDRYTVLSGDVLSDAGLRAEIEKNGPYNAIFANIVADVILALSMQVSTWLAPGGVFLCSGILDERAEEVEDALQKNGWNVLQRLDRDGWCALAAGKE